MKKIIKWLKSLLPIKKKPISFAGDPPPPPPPPPDDPGHKPKT